MAERECKTPPLQLALSALWSDRVRRIEEQKEAWEMAGAILGELVVLVNDCPQCGRPLFNIRPARCCCGWEAGDQDA